MATKLSVHQKVKAANDISEVQQFAALLGPLARDYTEPQLWQLRQEMLVMAEILLDFYFIKTGPNQHKTDKTS